MKHVLYIILYYMNVPKTTKMCTNQNCGTVLCNAPELPNLYFFFAIFPGLERTPWEPSETFAARYLLWCHSPLGYSAEGWMPSDACDSLGFQTFTRFRFSHWNTETSGCRSDWKAGPVLKTPLSGKGLVTAKLTSSQRIRMDKTFQNICWAFQDSKWY